MAHYASASVSILDVKSAVAAVVAGVCIEQDGLNLADQFEQLNSTVQNYANGLELSGMLAVCASKVVVDAHGPLKKMNNGRNVLFFHKSQPFLEVDGLAFGDNVLVVAELKSTIDMGMRFASARPPSCSFSRVVAFNFICVDCFLTATFIRDIACLSLHA